jgi:hypothetical protein
MGHVCRICEQSLELSRKTPVFSTVLVNIDELEQECMNLEGDLHDSFNAFCFTCRRITMSVPIYKSCSEQVCYLRSQVRCFEELKRYGLLVDEFVEDENEVVGEVVGKPSYEPS